jgi:hypothetical protein
VGVLGLHAWLYGLPDWTEPDWTALPCVRVPRGGAIARFARLPNCPIERGMKRGREAKESRPDERGKPEFSDVGRRARLRLYVPVCERVWGGYVIGNVIM